MNSGLGKGKDKVQILIIKMKEFFFFGSLRSIEVND
jgi:hypothetical protein